MNKSGFLTLLKASIPVIAGFQLTMVMAVIDVVMLRNFGSGVIGGLGLATTCTFVFNAFLIGIGAVLQASVARNQVDNKEKISLILGTTLRWIVIFSSLLAVASLMLLPFITEILSSNDQVRLPFKDFMWIWLAAGMVPYAIAQTLCYYYLGLKRNQMVLVAIIVSVASNILFNWLFLQGYGGDNYMGIKGIAMGKAISYIIEMAFFLIVLSREGIIKRIFSFDLKIMIDQLKHGIPTGSKFISESIFVTVLYILIDRLGDSSLALHHILMRIWLIVYTFLMGIAICSQSYMSESLGAGKLATAKKWCVETVKVAFVVCAIVLIPLNIFNEEVLFWFTKDTDQIAEGGQIIYVLSLSFLFFPYSVSSGYYLIASKKNNTDLLVSFVVSWGVFLPAVVYAIMHSKSLIWIWSFMIVVEFIRAAVYYFVRRKYT